MTPKDKAIKALLENGYTFDRHGANHDLYVNKTLNKKIPIKRHDFTENALRYIEKEIKQNKRGS